MPASTKTSKSVYLKVIKKYFRVINLSAFSFFHHLLQRDSCPLFSLAFICCRHKSKYFQGFVLVYRWLARVKDMNDFFQQRQVAIVRAQYNISFFTIGVSSVSLFSCAGYAEIRSEKSR